MVIRADKAFNRGGAWAAISIIALVLMIGALGWIKSKIHSQASELCLWLYLPSVVMALLLGWMAYDATREGVGMAGWQKKECRRYARMAAGGYILKYLGIIVVMVLMEYESDVDSMPMMATALLPLLTGVGGYDSFKCQADKYCRENHFTVEEKKEWVDGAPTGDPDWNRNETIKQAVSGWRKIVLVMVVIAMIFYFGGRLFFDKLQSKWLTLMVNYVVLALLIVVNVAASRDGYRLGRQEILRRYPEGKPNQQLYRFWMTENIAVYSVLLVLLVAGSGLFVIQDKFEMRVPSILFLFPIFLVTRLFDDGLEQAGKVYQKED